MSPDLESLFAELDTGERGFLVGLFSVPAVERPGVVAALAAPEAIRCGRVLSALERLPRPERAEILARLAREVVTVFPPGIEHVHPSWLRERLTRESPPVLHLLAEQPSCPTALREVVQAILSDLPSPTPSASPTSPSPSPSSSPPGADLAVSEGAAAELCAAALSDIVPTPLSASADGAAMSPARLGLRLVSLDAKALARELRNSGGSRALGRRLRTEEDTDPPILAVAQRLPLDQGRELLDGAGLPLPTSFTD